jgi:FkbM family methyltransferase
LKETVDIAGFTIRHASEGGFKELFREIFVDGIYFFECETERPTIVDCGSNIGISVIFFKLLYPSARIIAFEPDPYTFEILKENVSKNGLTDVELHQCALTNEEGTTTFFRPVDTTTSSLRMNVLGAASGNISQIEVPARRLSSFVEGRSVDLLKVDVEGAENGILADMASSGTLQNVKRVLLEYHHHLQPDRDDLSWFLGTFEKAGFGYQFKARGPSWPSERVFQEMMIYCYRKQA